MKAHIEKGKSTKKTEGKTIRFSGPGPYHGHPIRLTIGLIVKNEEKTLDRCLKSLQPLRDAVESELIITDTGSTDRTVEIAQKYTDHILHFQWCDDFAAARNTGIDAARGEWFLFLDGDEWFENTDDLIQFFQSGECDRYGTAAYTIRSYADPKGKQYSETPSLRVSRMYPGIRFRNAVHENLGWITPTKFLSDRVNHDGYVFENEAEKQKKYERNRALLERELKNDPYDLKAYYQLSKQYLHSDAGLAEKYSSLGLKAEREHPDRGWMLALMHNRFQALYLEKKYERLLYETDELMRQDSKPEVISMDYRSLAQSAALLLNEYERSASHGRAYLQLYDQYQAGQLDKELMLITEPMQHRPENKEQSLRLLAEAEMELGDTDRAMKELEEMDLSAPGSAAPALALACRVCAKAEDWSELPAFYQRACSAAGENSQAEVQREMEAALLEKEEQRIGAARALAGLPWEDDPCVRLCRLRKAEADADRDMAKGELDWFCRWQGDWVPLFSDAVFYTMKEKRNLVPLVLTIDADGLSRYAANMQRQHSDFAEVVRDYFNAFSFDSPHGLAWSVCLMEKVLLQEQNPFETEDEEIRFFEEYAGQLAKYVRALYRPELLSKEKVSVLPRAHRFGYYMGLALTARKRSEDTEYISNLRLALKCCPVMERQISLLLTRFERESREKRAKAEEFSELAKQVKTNIRTLIAQNRMEEAGQFTTQLAALMPDDPDVIQFRTLTHTEPDMNELAAHLPQ